MAAPADPLPRGEETRSALVVAALALFGDKGFEATSTREIAARARVNIAMIAYHFGGKEGLRMACAAFVGARVREMFDAAGPFADGDAAEARKALAALARALVRGLVRDEAAAPFARFLIREASEDSPAFERVFAEAFAPLHKRACLLWARATGAAAESETTKLSVFALVAQIVYFRIARPAVLMRMGWPSLGDREAAAIETTILSNLEAALDAAGSRAR